MAFAEPTQFGPTHASSSRSRRVFLPECKTPFGSPHTYIASRIYIYIYTRTAERRRARKGAAILLVAQCIQYTYIMDNRMLARIVEADMARGTDTAAAILVSHEPPLLYSFEIGILDASREKLPSLLLRSRVSWKNSTF